MLKRLLKTEEKMLRKKKIKSYESLPIIYEHIMRLVHYDEWAEYIYGLSKDFVKKNPKVLELGAGNCKLANHLKNKFPNIIATDLSKNMLITDAVENKLPKVCADMTKLPFKSKFDLIFSTFDSVNYLTSTKKLNMLFSEVKELLNDDGVFTFDISLEKNSYKHSRIANRTGTVNGVRYEQTSNYNSANRIHKNIFKLKYLNGKTVTEIHKQKIYQFEEYFKQLDLAGMYVVKCYNAFTFSDGNSRSARLQFITKKY